MIKRNTRRISDLINELLLSSRPADIVTKKQSMNKLVDDTIALAMDRITLKSVRIEKNISDDVCEISVDESKIITAFLNIIINAVEAVPEKDVIIILSAFREGNQCVITIPG